MSDVPTTLIDTHAALVAGEVSSRELVETSLASIAGWEPHINAFTEVLAAEARGQANWWDTNRTDEAPLGGIPIGVKDVICTLEGHTTAASNILRGFRSPYEATAIVRLKAAGAIIMGKLNCDAFAMGASTEYSDVGPTKNPWDTSRVPGGSSGGSAAAVAANEVIASLGTETGGSVRYPSSLCNTVGLKPTYGRISRFGVIAYGSSLDQIGPITRTVKDNALLLKIMAGPDELDATSSLAAPPDYLAACGSDIKKMVIGVPQEFFGKGVSAEVEQAVRTAIAHLEKLGMTVKEISLPLTPLAIAVYYLIAKSEGSTNLSRYDGIRYGQVDAQAATLLEQYLSTRGNNFGPEVKRTILMGTYALSSGYYDAWYKQASKVRTLIQREYQQAFKDVDVIVGPVVPEVAYPLGSKASDPLAMYLSDALTAPINVAGIPALAVPCGFADTLPIGMQLIAPHWQEERLFAVGHAYEQSTDWHTREPVRPTVTAVN